MLRASGPSVSDEGVRVRDGVPVRPRRRRSFSVAPVARERSDCIKGRRPRRFAPGTGRWITLELQVSLAGMDSRFRGNDGQGTRRVTSAQSPTAPSNDSRPPVHPAQSPAGPSRAVAHRSVVIPAEAGIHRLMEALPYLGSRGSNEGAASRSIPRQPPAGPSRAVAHRSIPRSRPPVRRHSRGSGNPSHDGGIAVPRESRIKRRRRFPVRRTR